MMILKYIIILTLLVQVNNVKAWNAAGHQLMAAISWDLMSKRQQNYWVDILKHHPRFDQDFQNNIPKYVRKNSKTYNEWLFRQAARWPDLPRGFLQKAKDKFHHGSWHYINYPIYLDETVNTKFLNLNTNWKGNFHNGLNVIQALKGNIQILSKQGATKKQKALALSWVLHLVGDSHQPLHSTALFSATYFPKGDRGGNLSLIKGQGRYTNLHWYWDARLDNTTSFKIIDLKAKKLAKKYKKIAKKSRKNPINSWLKNSNAIAREYVYTNAVLATLKSAENHRRQQPKVNISNDYDVAAREQAQIQIVKAAYQMVELLKKH